MEVLARMTGMSLSYYHGSPVMEPVTNHVDPVNIVERGPQTVDEPVGEFPPVAFTIQSIRSAFAPVMNRPGVAFRNRAAHLLIEIMKRSPGIPGKRDLELSKHRQAFQDFDLCVMPFDSAYMGDLIGGIQRHRNRAFIDGKIRKQDLHKMPGSTHFRLMHIMGVVSDTVFDSALDTYVAANPTVNGLNEITYTDYCPINFKGSLEITLETEIPGDGLLERATLLEALGIEVFCECDDVRGHDLDYDYLMPQYSSIIVLGGR